MKKKEIPELSFHEARKLLLSAAFLPAGDEIMATRNAFGRILSRDTAVNRDFPDTAKSAVDGYGITNAEAGSYRLAGEIQAGQTSIPSIKSNEALFIMTGAPVPSDVCAIVRVEDAEIQDGVVVITRQPEKGDNINAIGNECRAGSVIAYKGAPIEKGLFPALIYAGLDQVPVYKKPRIALISSGDELLEVEDTYRTGMTINTNRYIFESLSSNLPLDCEVYTSLADDLTSTRQILTDLRGKVDLVITSGGISRGKYDFIRDTLQSKPFSPVLYRTAIKPGSPLLAAALDETLYLAMPGYPSAFLTNMVLYLIPVLKKLCGLDYQNLPVVKGILATPVTSKKGTDTFIRVTVETREGIFYASNPGSQKTSHFVNFASCGGLVHLDRETGSLDAGREVMIYLF